jgi:hypothetical protein
MKQLITFGIVRLMFKLIVVVAKFLLFARSTRIEAVLEF